MAMDFFAAQDSARRRTGVLLVLLCCAVLALIATTTLAILIALQLMRDDPQPWSEVFSQTSGELIGCVAAAILALVTVGGLVKWAKLRRGGRVVAEALGGRELHHETQNANERRILNVVEEMAIAAGLPVPPVYVLEEAGINAFAAGRRPADAVIGITRGAIEYLNRDELQGVVAHEFSHILHGDMRLNLRLVGVLHGVLLIGLLGHILMRAAPARRSSGNRKGKDSGAVVVFLGLALVIIGAVGTFFGNWIKAAVSRQREYLADASAVQFTRRPEGIGQALIKIGSHMEGSRLNAKQAHEFSHLYFGEGTRVSFRRLLATHPPLRERIRRVLPQWEGRFDPTLLQTPTDAKNEEVEDSHAKTEDASPHTDTPAERHAAPLHSVTAGAGAATLAIAAMGQPDTRHLSAAKGVIAAMPPAFKAAARSPVSARALMYGLLLSADDEVRAIQLETLDHAARAEVNEALTMHAEGIEALDERLRLPLVELALPALKHLSREEALQFKGCISLLIEADGRVGLFEWALRRILLQHLGLDERRRMRPKRQLSELKAECAVLLTHLAAAGQQEHDQIIAALEAAGAGLPFALDIDGSTMDTAALDAAVMRLSHVRPQQKAMLLAAMARCVEHSGQVLPREAELFRAVADTLECPVPPLLGEKE